MTQELSVSDEEYEAAVESAMWFRLEFDRGQAPPKQLVRSVGPSMAMFLMYLIKTEDMARHQKQITEHGYCAFSNRLGLDLGLNAESVHDLRREAENRGLIHVWRDPMTEQLYHIVDNDTVFDLIREDIRRNDTRMVNQILEDRQQEDSEDA